MAPILLKLISMIQSRGGNFAVLSAILAVPMIGAVALATDYSNLVRQRIHLQNATDAAAFFLAQEYDRTRTVPTSADAEEIVSAAFGSVEEVAVSVIGDELSVTARADEPLAFSSFLKSDVGTIRANSTVSLPGDRIIHVAMVLDSTFSMSADGKMTAMKAAANKFIDTLLDAENARTDVRIGIVPFANYVNVGLANRNKSWMSVPPDSEETSYECRMMRDVTGKSNCRTVTRYNDGVSYQAEQCDYQYGPEREECKNVTRRQTWQGCVGSREHPLNLRDSRPEVKFPGLLNISCSGEIAALTNSVAALKATVSNIRAVGETYAPEGIMWGTRILSGDEPFTAPPIARIDASLERYMLLMTDGDNSRSAQLPNSPRHGGSNVTQANEWSIEACEQAKQSGIEVFSITFGRDVTADGRKIMERCASPGKYYNSSDADALARSFQSIAANISASRLVR